MLTNDIKKGTRLQLKNGWFGTMKDNGRGNTRIVEVEGNFTEMGSIYAWDIAWVWPNGVDNPAEYIELTDKQRRSQKVFANLF